jgi:hypothetical protein
LWQRQKVLKNLIEQEIHNLIKCLATVVFFVDLMMMWLVNYTVMTKGELTRPQIRQLWMFIKTAKVVKYVRVM